MTLAEGLAIAIEDQERHGAWKFTNELEERARVIVDLVSNNYQSPTPDDLAKAKGFLLDVERWKAMSIGDRMGAAAGNSDRSAWDAIRGAVSAGSDDQHALLWIMQLKGFGASTDMETGQRRAKVATSVLRFLFPNDWGVVDWRTASVLSLLNKCNTDIDCFFALAKQYEAKELRSLSSRIDEGAAVQINEQYRRLRCHDIPRAADVDMALFGMSLKAWPIVTRRNRFV